MKRRFAFLVILGMLFLVFSLPALAQDSSPNPAAYLPSDLPLYLELRTDSAELAAFSQLMSVGIGFSH